MSNGWQAFGRGIIKLFVSLLAGSGVALLVIGYAAQGDPAFWHGREPPGGFFAGLGAGLLTTAAMLVLLFFIPWWWRRSLPPRDEREYRRGASRAEE